MHKPVLDVDLKTLLISFNTAAVVGPWLNKNYRK